MASNLKIKTIFSAIDKITAPIKKMQSKISAFSGKSGRALNNFSKQTRRSSSTLGGMLKTFALVTAVGIFTRAIKNAIDVGKEFEKTIDSVSSKFDNLSPENLIAIEKAARQVGATTEFTATQAAEGLSFLALAGFTAEEAITSLPKVVDLATAANIDLASASDIATDSLSAFGMASDDATVQAAKLENIMDVMLATTTKSNTNLEQLFDAVAKGGSTFVSAGQSMETFNALSGRLADSAIKGGEAGTALRNIMLRLSKPTGESAKVLKDLGVTTTDAEGNFRDITDIIADFETGLEGMGTAQRTAALTTVFGARSTNAFNILLKAGSGNLKEFRTELENSSGKTKEMAAIMRDNLNGQVKSLQSRFESIKIEAFNIMLPLITKIVAVITDLATKTNDFLMANNNLLSSGIMSFFSSLGSIIGSVFMIISKVVAKITEIFTKQKGVESLKTAFAQFKETLDVVFGVLGEIFGEMETTGALDAMIGGLILTVNLLTLMLKLLKPIIKFIGLLVKIILKINAPLINMVRSTVGLLNKISGFFGGVGEIGGTVESEVPSKDATGTSKQPSTKSVDDTLVNLTGLFGSHSGVDADDKGDISMKNTIVTPQQSSIQQQNNQRSQLDVNFNNTPNGTKIKQTGNDNNLNLNVSSQLVLG